MGKIGSFIMQAAGFALMLYPPTMGIGIALMVAGTALQMVQAKRDMAEAMKSAQSSQAGIQGNTRTSQTVVSYIAGRQKVGWNILYQNTYTERNGIPNGAADLIGGLCEGEIDAVEEVWFDDVLVWRNGTKLDTIYRDWFSFEWRPGTADQTYFFWPHFANPDYEDCYIFTAVAYLHLDYNAQVWANYPEFTFVIRGKKCYDPRDETVKWTRTGPLQWRDLMTSQRFGAGVAEEKIDDVAVGEEATYAEAVVNRGENLVVTGETVGMGAGQGWVSEGVVVSSGSGTLKNRPVSPGSVSIWFGYGGESSYDETFTDNGAGVLVGSIGGSGTIAYDTGVVTFSLTEGDGSASYVAGPSTFTFRLHAPIIEPGTVVIHETVETFTDNGAGVLAGDKGGTGTVDYATGEVSVTFHSAPLAGGSITADYESSSGPRYTCDFYAVDGGPVMDVLRDLLAHFQAVVLKSADLYRLRIEKPGSVVGHFRSGGLEDAGNNIVDGSFTWRRSGMSEIPSAIRIKWTNPLTGYRIQDYVIPVSSAGGNSEVSLNLPGITDLAVVERLIYTRRNLALLDTFCELKANLSAIPLEPLDLADVIHPAAGWSTAKQFRVDAMQDSIKDEQIGLSFREYNAAAYVDQPVIVNVEPPPVIPPPSSVPPVVANLSLTEILRQLGDGTWTSLIRVTWDAPANYPYVDAYEVYVRYEGETTGYVKVGETRELSFEFGPVKPKVKAYVLVVVRSVAGIRYMENGTLGSIIPAGKVENPSDVQFIDDLCVFTAKVVLQWTPVGDLDLAFYEIRTDLNWGQETGRVFVGATTSFWLAPTVPTYTFYIKACDTSGNYSLNYDTIVLTHHVPVPVWVSADGTKYGRARIEWEPISDESYDVVEIWRSGANDRNTAALVGQIHSNVFSDTSVTAGAVYYYWLRTKSIFATYSLWESGVNAGHSVTTATLNLTEMMDVLTGNITTEALSTELQTLIEYVDPNTYFESGTFESGVIEGWREGLFSEHAFLRMTVSDVAGIAGQMTLAASQWTVKLNAHGHVAGVGLILDPISVLSQFIIVADEFAVVQPGEDPGTLKVPFIIGTVDGVSQVGINGSLLVDGTIFARSLVTGSITTDKLTFNNLLGLDPTAAGKLGTIQTGADVTLMAIQGTLTVAGGGIILGSSGAMIRSGNFALPNDGDTQGVGFRIADSGNVEAYGLGHTFGGTHLSSDGNFMVSSGKYLTSAGSIKRYPLNNATNFTADGQMHIYYWDTVPATPIWQSVVSLGIKSGGVGWTPVLVQSRGAITYGAMIFDTADSLVAGIYAESTAGAGYGGMFYGGNEGGIGVKGLGQDYGGEFDGALKAPILLTPSANAPAPTHTAAKGSLWVTSAGILYINTDGGTTWQKVGAQ